MKTALIPTTSLKSIAVNSQKGIKLLDVEKNVFLESSKRYTIIYKKDFFITMCKNLKHCKLFKPSDSSRINNSLLINESYLSTIIKDSGGQYSFLVQTPLHQH